MDFVTRMLSQRKSHRVSIRLARKGLAGGFKTRVSIMALELRLPCPPCLRSKCDGARACVQRRPPAAARHAGAKPKIGILEGFGRAWDHNASGRSAQYKHLAVKFLDHKLPETIRTVVHCGLAAAVCMSLGWGLPSVSFAADSTSVGQELPPIPTDFPALPDLSVPAYEKFQLINGLRVFLLEDHELGLVGGELLLKGGGNMEPEDKVGLARMTSAVQRSGGTISHPADALDSELESMAARIEASSSLGSMNVAFRCLEEDLNNVFSIFADVVQKPIMPQDKLELVRAQLLGAIARRGDAAENVASIEFRKLLYGDRSIYARLPEMKTVKAVTRNDLKTFHKQLFHPDTAVLGIWGDFDSSKMRALIEEEFTNWGTTGTNQEMTRSLVGVTNGKALEPGISFSEPRIYLVDRPGLTQGYVRMGELGTTISDPDLFALDVLNGVLNSFGGLLFDEVRSREGLAYSVSGGWSPAVEHRGAFVAGGETQLSSLPKFVKAVQRVLETVIQRPISEDQLAQAKEAALNSFVFNFSNRESQLARVLTYDLFGIDQDLPFKYKTKVEQVTREEILQAAQRHLHPNMQPIVIVTDAEKLRPHMSSFGAPVVPLKTTYGSK